MDATVGIDDLETAMAHGWWPLEHAWLDGRSGTWLLRASAGFTGRGNSALPLGDPGLPLAGAVDRVEDFYRSRGLPPRFAVPAPTVGSVAEGALASALGARGYRPVTPTAVMVAAAADVPRVDHADVELLEAPDDDWLSVYRYLGEPLPAAAAALLTGSEHQRFARVRRAGATVAVARVAVWGGWAGITAMRVADDHRGRGLARAVLAAIAGYAGRAGGPRLYLQVAVENAPARALYASAGFTDHHGYHYRVLPT